MLARRRKRWSNIKTTSVRCLVFAEGGDRERLVSRRTPGREISQQTRYTNSMSVQCWSTVHDAGPTSDHHRVDVSCLLGYSYLAVDSQLPACTTALSAGITDP